MADEAILCHNHATRAGFASGLALTLGCAFESVLVSHDDLLEQLSCGFEL